MAIYPLAIIAITPQISAWLRNQKHKFKGIPVSAIFVLLLMTWSFSSLAIAFPGYLSYSNWFAGKDPGYVVNDSDLDWGQSAYALRDYLEDIDEPVSLLYNGSAKLCHLRLEGVRPFSPDQIPEGLVIISERVFRIMVALVESGEEQFRIGAVRTDICDPSSLVSVVVNADQIQWLLTENPITIIDRTLRVYRM